MAAEETEVAQATAEAGKGGKGGFIKTLGITIGLFVLMLSSQLVAPVLGCKFLPDMMPGCGEASVVAEDSTAKEEEVKGPPIYLPLDPPLVVSFEDQNAIRFLQVTVEVMARDEKAIQAVTNNMPVIRNNLLMLMGGRTLTDLITREGKEKLRADCLAEVKDILVKLDSESTIEDLYFTSFVVQ